MGCGASAKPLGAGPDEVVVRNAWADSTDLDNFWAPPATTLVSVKAFGQGDPEVLVGSRDYNMEEHLTKATRPQGLKINAAEPFNAEPALDRLVGSLAELPSQAGVHAVEKQFSFDPKFITPIEAFYVRSHGPVPEPKVASQEDHVVTFELGSVAGGQQQEIKLRVGDLLKQHPFHRVTAMLMCAGNRRNELSAVSKVKGVGWDAGAVGCGQWGGISLRDVLRSLLPSSLLDAALWRQLDIHLEMEGADWCKEEKGRLECGFCSSAPLGDILRNPDILLVVEMNGLPLNPDHGYPLRVVYPGVIGARSTKWLWRMRLLLGPSRGFFVAEDYKLFSPSVTLEQAQWDQLPALFDYGVMSAVAQALYDPTTGKTTATGYALAGGGRGILRIEVGGGNFAWKEVAASERVDQHGFTVAKMGRCYSWTLWSIELDSYTPGDRVTVRAVDSAGNVQPTEMAEIWNFRGLLGNGPHAAEVVSMRAVE